MTLDEINKVLEFYQDRGLINERPSNSVVRKLIDKYQGMNGPTGVDSLMNEVNRVGATGDIGRSMPLGKPKQTGRLPSKLKQLRSILGEYQDSLSAAKVPKGMSSAEIAAVLDPEALPVKFGQGPSTRAMGRAANASSVANAPKRLGMRANEYLPSIVGNKEVARTAAKEGAKLAEVVGSNPQMRKALAPLAKSPEVKAMKNALPKSRLKSLAKLASKNKLATAGLLALGLFGYKGLMDGSSSEEAPAEMAPPQPQQPQPTQPTQRRDPYMEALLKSMNPSANATTTELAESLRGAAEIAKALGAESLGSRDAIRGRTAQPTPQLQQMGSRY